VTDRILSDLIGTVRSFFRTAGGFEGKEISTPSNPASGYRRIYPKTDGWYDLDDGGNETLLGSGADVGLAVTQTAHGFTDIGTPVYLTESGYFKAQADTAVHAEVVGCVGAIDGPDDFTLNFPGSVMTGLSGLTKGLVYFLDPDTAGAVTDEEPAISKPVYEALSTTTAVVMGMRGLESTVDDTETEVNFLRQNVQRLMLQLSMVGNIAAGTMSGGVFDHFEDESGIDTVNSIATYADEFYTAIEEATGLTADEDITSVGTSTGTALIQDIKASITTFTKDGTATGHFNVANTAVVVGCVITFADASTATIVAKTGDGTGTSSITLSVDHATDASLASITGLVYSAPNVQINVCVQADGSLNADTNYATQDHTSNTVPTPSILTCSSYNGSGYEAWRAFDQALDGSSWMSTEGDIVGAWLKYDCGEGNSLVINKYDLFNRTGTGSAKSFKSWSLQGSNNDADWVTLHSISGNTMDTRGYWKSSGTATPAYYTFINGVAYRYYRLYVTESNDATQTCVGEVKLIAAGYTAPSALFAVHTNTAQLNTSLWSAITDVAITRNTPVGCAAHHAVSLNKGNAAEEWWVYLSSAWRGICRVSSGTWQYKDSGGTYQNATINSRLGALSQAFGVTENQMTGTVLEAITAGQWATVFVAGTLDFATGLQASGSSVPTLDKWTVTYNQAAQNMVLISDSTTISPVITKASASVLVKNYDASVAVSVSTATSPSYTELTGLSKVASNVGGAGIDQYASDEIAVTGSADKALRWKVEMDVGNDSELHGVVVNYL
jgi:hypothetical protein